MSTSMDRSPPQEESSASTLARCSSPLHDVIDELLLEIISRVPARDRWRCKLVCKLWLRLAKTLPQSLAGFYYTTYSAERLPVSVLHFFNISGILDFRRPIYLSFGRFLPDHRHIDLLDSRNGLLLCSLWGASAQATNNVLYVVCNPSTREWVPLPDRSQPAGKVINARLGFDPAASSHFHVFLLLEDDDLPIFGVDLYSSKTRRWVHKEKRWDLDVHTTDVREETVFLNGYLHFHAYVGGYHNGMVPYIAAVATDGETWTTITVPTLTAYDNGFIQLSQGCLHYACFETNEDDAEDFKLAIYVLEDYNNKQWKLKHRVQTTDMFGGLVDCDDLDEDFDWIAIHPECNVIFFAAGDPKQFMCYNMDLQKAKVIRTLRDGHSPYLPYVPLHTELQSLRM